MGLKHFALLALSGTQVWASETVKRQSQAKYCPGSTPICFSEFKVPTHDIIYRIAIPDVSAAPFDVLLQIVAPVSNGWAAIAWGGKMSNNPLTVAWPNGKSAVVSSRFATGRTLPGVYTGATYAILPTSNTNATHWQLDVLCRGCSQWSGGSLNPNGVNDFAWAKSSAAVNTASSNSSSFQIHNGRGVFSHDLSAAKIPKGVFDAVAYDLENPPVASSAPPVVSTSVVTLPRPSSAVSSIPTRLTVLPTTSFVYVTTRVTQLPPRPSTSTSQPVIVITVTNSLPSAVPSRTTTTQRVVTVTVTATATPTQGGPPWAGGGGGGWGGPPWGKGKGKGKGKGWGRRERLAAEPEE
ncbi:cellobiose dehydrogenase [Cladorrhinum sp. PSN332]|nr:cellobiose dehydrogenase [Cladorrhinum sp. PSN332]